MIFPTDEAVLDRLTTTLVDAFAPQKIILFGSRARGDHHLDSDYDLVVVVDRPPVSEDELDPIPLAAREVHGAVDVIVDSPERFERRRTDVGTIEYVADREGRVLYERASPPAPRRVHEDRTGSPESLAEWLFRARSDFAMMEAGRLAAPDARDGIVFHAHQGAEKLLKAVLVSRHVNPPRTHLLVQVLALTPAEMRDDAGVRDACLFLDHVWPTTRYPQAPLPTAAQTRRAVEHANGIRDAVLRLGLPA
jgi:HEPN domain-containing protein